MIPRHASTTLQRLANGFPVLAITGPRQSGKTTLARALFGHKPYVSLENPEEREFAQTDPKRFLARFAEGAVLDEVQRCPALLSWLQTLVDDYRDQSIDIAFSGPPRLVYFGRPLGLKRVMTNLVDNAIRHSPKDAKGDKTAVVEVDVTDDGHVNVRDRGPGIPVAEQAMVFTRFWQGPTNQSGESAHGGAGLGAGLPGRVDGRYLRL